MHILYILIKFDGFVKSRVLGGFVKSFSFKARTSSQAVRRNPEE